MSAGLFPTKHRKAFLRAVAVQGRVVVYTSTHEAWDNTASVKVTSRLTEVFQAGWVEPVPAEDLWPGAEPKSRCTFYRLTAEGKKLIEEKRNG